MRRLNRVVELLVLGAALLLTGCSDVRLEFPDEEIDLVDVGDKLLVSGSFCTSPPGNVKYPVKILFVVDGSGSQQFSDQNRQRVVAVEETYNALAGQPNVEFKVIVFNASISATPATLGVFTSDPGQITTALTNLAEADTLTDYQGALSRAYAELLEDMRNTMATSGAGPTQLARTKYVVILISDGLPDPQCQAGLCNDIDPNFPVDPVCGVRVNRICENQAFLNCLLQQPACGPLPCTSCSGNVCTYDDGTTQTTCFKQANAAALFGGASTELAGGNDYNQVYQILQRADDIMTLGDRFEVGELRLHAGLVLDPLADPAVIAVFGDAAQAKPLMQQIAEIGQGQYLEFYGGDSINFLSINFDSLKQQRVVRTFFADNINARIYGQALLPDTDGDGMTDAEEFRIYSNALTPDTDGDGYSDLLEWRMSGFNYDYDDACLPPFDDSAGTRIFTTACPTPNCEQMTGGGFRDDDLDGLYDCEERALKTDPLNPDTDADGIPDQLDYVMGLDPNNWDWDKDFDQDALPNGTEIEWHLNPEAEQTDIATRDRYRYQRDYTGNSLDGRACFDFGVKNIRLAPTGEPTRLVGQGVGFNRIMFTLGENLADALSSPPIYRVACLDTRYVPPALKTPFDTCADDGATCTKDEECNPGVRCAARVELREEDFHYLYSRDPLFSDTTVTTVATNLFDAATNCLQACNEHSDCGGCPGEGCVRGICRPTNWTCCDNGGCAAEDACLGHLCRSPCTLNVDCGTDMCFEGYCWSTCDTDRDCPNNNTCNEGRCWPLPLD